MSRSAGPVRTLLLVLAAGGTGLLLGLGAVSVASSLGSAQDQNLGEPVVFDPAAVTPTPTRTPAEEPGAGTATPTADPTPERVVPAAPSAAPTDDDDVDG